MWLVERLLSFFVWTSRALEYPLYWLWYDVFSKLQMDYALSVVMTIFGSFILFCLISLAYGFFTKSTGNTRIFNFFKNLFIPFLICDAIFQLMTYFTYKNFPSSGFDEPLLTLTLVQNFLLSFPFFLLGMPFFYFGVLLRHITRFLSSGSR